MEMWLDWKSFDGVFEYVYYLVIEFKYGFNYISMYDKVIIFQGLILGILYNIIIFLEVDYVWGDFNFIVQYIWFSNVFNIDVSINIIVVILSWQNFDDVFFMYFYCFFIEKVGNFSNVI